MVGEEERLLWLREAESLMLYTLHSGKSQGKSRTSLQALFNMITNDDGTDTTAFSSTRGSSFLRKSGKSATATHRSALPVDLARVQSGFNIRLRDYYTQKALGRSNYDVTMKVDGIVHLAKGLNYYDGHHFVCCRELTLSWYDRPERMPAARTFVVSIPKSCTNVRRAESDSICTERRYTMKVSSLF